MAKYAFGGRWGGGTLWGGTGVVATPFNGYVVWIVKIDWVGAGGINESDYVRGVDISRGRQHYVTPSGSGFEKMRPGKSTIIMDNSNGRFDPYNTESPLYGYLLPGRKIQISVYDVVTKQTHVRFTGHITDIQPSSGINEVTITAEDGIRWLTDAEYSTGVTYSKTVSEAIDLVLSFVNWPYQRNIIYTNEPLQVFEPGEGSAINVIQDLAEANIGVFFVDRFGTACFYPISYDVTTSHNIDQSQILREIRIPRPWETVRNKIRIVANRRGKRPGTAVWTMAGKERFEAGETKVFGATFKVSDGLTVENIIANTQLDGNGVDVSNYFTIGKSDITSTECTLTITNNYGSVAYLLSLRLIGNAIVSAPENKTDFDAASITTYGPRSFVLNNPWLQDRNFAGAYVTMVKNHLKDSRKDPIIQIQQRPDIQYPIDLYDKVVLTSTNLGISETFTVGGIEEKWMSDTGQDVITTLYLQTILYDPTYIEPDPFIPGDLPIIPLPDIPPWIDPYIPPIPPFPPDWTFNCLTESAPNGPFPLSPNPLTLTTTPSVLMSTMNYPCTLRAKTALYKSILTLNIKTYSMTDGLWTPYTPNDIIRVTAFNKSNVDVAEAVVSGGGTAMTARTAMFFPDAAIEVAGFRLYLENEFQDGIPSSDVSLSSDSSTEGPTYDIRFPYFTDDTPWLPGSTDIESSNTASGDSNQYTQDGQLVMNMATHSNWRFFTNLDLSGDFVHPASTDSYFEVDVIENAGFAAFGIYFIGAVNPWKYYNLFGKGEGTFRYSVPSDVTNYAIKFFGFDTTGGGATRYRVINVLLHNFLWNNVFKDKKIDIITITASNICGTGLV